MHTQARAAVLMSTQPAGAGTAGIAAVPAPWSVLSVVDYGAEPRVAVTFQMRPLALART